MSEDWSLFCLGRGPAACQWPGSYAQDAGGERNDGDVSELQMVVLGATSAGDAGWDS